VLILIDRTPNASFLKQDMPQQLNRTATLVGISRFATTQWGIVWRAQGRDTQQAGALDKVCRVYWQPLYAYIRREGYGPEDAQDLTQEFFARLVQRNWLGHLEHQRGKFRSFLLTLLKHFLSDQRDRARAIKRGGGLTFVSLDDFTAEERGLVGPVEHLTAEHLYHRRWVQAILEESLDQLRSEYASTGRLNLYEQLSDLEAGDRQSPGYAAVAAGLEMSESAVKSAVHRLRVRYRQILRQRVAETVGCAEDVGEEIRDLMNALGG
jgi:DNA-directed RNA polymerase specialized sigma24 family protein